MRKKHTASNFRVEIGGYRNSFEMLVNTSEILWCRYSGNQNIHFHFRDKIEIVSFHLVLWVNVVTPMYFLFLTPSNSWLNLQTNIIKMHSFRMSWQRRYISSEDEQRHISLSLFSRISTNPLNEIICPQIWQNLNFALLIFTTSLRSRGQQTCLSSRCFKIAGNTATKENSQKQENHMHIPAVRLHIISTGITASFKSMKERNWTYLPLFSAYSKY